MKKISHRAHRLILLYLAYDTARYYLGWYIDLQPDAPVTAFATTDTQSIYMDRGSGPEPFTVKGVNLGVGLPASGRRTTPSARRPICAGLPDAGDGREHRARLHYAA